MDQAKKAQIDIDVELLSQRLGVPIVPVSARKLEGIDQLKNIISYANQLAMQVDSIDVKAIAPALITDIGEEIDTDNPYFALQLAHQHETLKFLSPAQSSRIEELEQKHAFHSQKAQATETVARYNYINDVLYDTVQTPVTAHDESISNKIDKILTHRVFGFIIFMGVLLFMFQSIFAWSAYPMSLIENIFIWMEGGLRTVLPGGPLANLLIDGVVAGLSRSFGFYPSNSYSLRLYIHIRRYGLHVACYLYDG